MAVLECGFMKKFICKLLGHRSILIFIDKYKWPNENWAQTTTIYRCERCGHDEHTVYQSPV